MSGSHLISVWISSSDSYSERLLSPHLSIAELRSKLQPITGIPAGSQWLALNPPPGQSDLSHPVLLEQDHLTLSDYRLQEGSTIDVVDRNPHAASQAGQYNDVSQVQKFELPAEEYEKRSDSLLAFKIRNKLGRFAQSNPNQSNQSQLAEMIQPDELSKRYPIGSRCQITSPSSQSEPLRGTLRFVGPVTFDHKFPYWLGVELDEPIGKNDGSVDGHRYFTCPPSRGMFVQPSRIEIGDFPATDFESLEDD